MANKWREKLFLGVIVSLLVLVAQHPVASASHTLPKSIQFDHLDVDGIDSLSLIVAIVQDHKGFMWFGGKNGLRRYDGYSVDSFRHDPDNPYSLGSNDISSLYVDSRGRLWVGLLSGGGLNRFDHETGRFIRYLKNENNPQSIGSNDVYSIAERSDGKLWIATHDNGINLLDPETETFLRFPHKINDQMGPSENAIRHLVVDRYDGLWMAMNSDGLNYRDNTTGRFEYYRHEADNPNSISENELYRLHLDRDSKLWIGYLTKGVSQFDYKRNKFVHYQNDPNDASSIAPGMVWSFIDDDLGRLWVATGNGAVNRFDAKAGNFFRYLHDPTDKSTISGTISSLFKDKAGDLWFGSYFSSIDRLSFNRTPFKVMHYKAENNERLGSNFVTALAQDEEGNIWIGTDLGLDYFDRSRGAFTHYQSDGYQKGRLPAAVIRSLIVDSEETLWVGTIGGGLALLDKGADSFRHIVAAEHQSLPNGFRGNKVSTLLEDSAGDIWLGTHKHGLGRYDRANDRFIFYTRDENAPADGGIGISNNYVWDIFEDSKGRLWVGTQNGLDLVDRETETFKHFRRNPYDPNSISSNSVQVIAEDQLGNLWVGTRSGLNRFQPELNRFSVYRVKHGLPDDNISGILADESGMIWVTTQRGISLLDPISETFRNFDSRHGVAGNSFQHPAFLKLASGELMFGSSQGISFVDPRSVIKNNYIPPVALTDFKIMNETVGVNEESPLDKTITYTRAIELDYDHSVISFEFTALSFEIPELNQYAYRLTGFDKDWVYTNSQHRRATYTNLDPGKYRFEVKASNNDGIWNYVGVGVDLKVLSPWWATWWARVLEFLAFVSAIYAFLYWRLLNNRIREARLKNVVREKTRELRIANEQVSKLNAGLEKKVEQKAGELTAEMKERRIAEDKLFHMAFHDALTGLPNRYWLLKHLNELIKRNRNEPGQKFGLMFLDGDRFKQVNDTHGHRLGDQLLIAAAKRLDSILGADQYAVRLGGDEFTIVLDNVEGIEDIKVLADKVISTFDRTFQIEKNLILFKVSIGMVLCDNEYSRPENILRDADIALYRAKDNNKGGYQIFDEKMREENIEAVELEVDLHNALDLKQFYLVYQPIINLHNGELHGFEALIRWHHPKKGEIPPEKFIAIAEETGDILSIGAWVLEEACNQLATWIQEYEFKTLPRMAVNLSVLQLNHRELISKIDGVLQQSGIPGHLLKLEITESALMEKSEAVTTLLDDLQNRDIQLAIDDFGTGYSSLSYLDQLPVQILKIDRSFVAGLSELKFEQGGAKEIVRAIVSLAHNLRMKVVAEGIENEVQLEILESYGCDYAQGSLKAAPLFARSVEGFMERNGIVRKKLLALS